MNNIDFLIIFQHNNNIVKQWPKTIYFSSFYIIN